MSQTFNINLAIQELRSGKDLNGADGINPSHQAARRRRYKSGVRAPPRSKRIG